MAIIKHIAIKNSNYDAATDYLTLKHDEYTCKPILDENGYKIPRDEFLIEGINCNPFTFGRECEATNALYNKNQTREEIKAHHYIISFDPRDRDENGLTLEHAKDMAASFARRNFPGHQTIICAHPDGHNSAGNIHVHIVINSVRKKNVTPEEIAATTYKPERAGDTLAGHKHHVTKPFLEYLKQETMSMCQESSLYQVDLLSPARVRITDREYWAKRRAQAKLDAAENGRYEKTATADNTTYKKSSSTDDVNVEPSDNPGNGSGHQTFTTDKDFLRAAIYAILDSIDISGSATPEDAFKTFSDKLFESYGITVHESRGRIGYILPDHVKPIRSRQLGTDFEKEHILEVLSEKLEKAKESGRKYQSSDIRLIADLEANIKAKENIYYARKVKIANLQQMSKTLNFLKAQNIESVETLDALLASTKTDVSEKHDALKTTEAELKDTNLLIKNTGQYLANKDTYRRYMKAPNKARFREEHIAEITLYEAARKYLKEAGYLQKQSDTSGSYLPNMAELKAQKQVLVSQKNQLYEEYSYSRAKYRELQTVHQNVHRMMDEPRKETAHTQNNNRTSQERT